MNVVNGSGATEELVVEVLNSGAAVVGTGITTR